MPTIDLIHDAEAAVKERTDTAAMLATAKTDDAQAVQAVTATAQALHDDLVTNGPYGLIDKGEDNAVKGVKLYTPVDPASYTTTDIRIT